jgi:1-deoxy-D-xylulose 5-phosphate reductoisomerase
MIAKTSKKTSQKIGVVLLGSTGNIGTQTLQILKKHKDKFEIIGLACHHNEKLLKKQTKEFKVPLKNAIVTSKNPPQKINHLIKNSHTEIIVNAISGEAGLKPSIAALKARKILALANKESIVLEGKKLITLAKKYSTKILPLDSEHHAIARILKEKNLTKFAPQKITLTCSGGPFFGWPRKQLAKATIKDALKHPTWRMGPKITLESATLLNKGYELIEAHHLFNCPLKNLDAIIDRKSYIHAIVEFKNPPLASGHAACSSSIRTQPPDFTCRTPASGHAAAARSLALAYPPDMRIPIEDTLLSYYHSKTGKKFKNPKLKFLTKNQLKNHRFYKIDHKTFPAIKETIKAYKQNRIKQFFRQKEKNIGLFLKGKIKFTQV